MVRKSASRGYILRARDDEPQLNITILELLKQEFGIHVQGLSPLPKDAHGLYEFDGLAFAKSSERPSAEVFAYMDTTDWKKYVHKYVSRTGNKDWPSLVRSFGLVFSEEKLRRLKK